MLVRIRDKCWLTYIRSLQIYRPELGVVVQYYTLHVISYDVFEPVMKLKTTRSIQQNEF